VHVGVNKRRKNLTCLKRSRSLRSKQPNGFTIYRIDRQRQCLNDNAVRRDRGCVRDEDAPSNSSSKKRQANHLPGSPWRVSLTMTKPNCKMPSAKAILAGSSGSQQRNVGEHNGGGGAMRIVITSLVGLGMLLIQHAAASSCPSGKIACADWCGKYTNQVTQCEETDPKSCMNKYGSLSYCVNDKPRAGTITCNEWCTKCWVFRFRGRKRVPTRQNDPLNRTGTTYG
jgi:hypothetical protein